MSKIGMNEELTTNEIVEGALRDMKELVLVEIDLAKEELKREANAAGRSVVTMAAGLVLLSTGLAQITAWLLVALSLGTIGSLVAGILLVTSACAAGAYAIKTWPKAIFGATRRRIDNDISELREHLS